MARAVQSAARRDRADLEHDGDLARRKLLPASEAQNLLILRPKTAESRPNHPSLGRKRWHTLDRGRQFPAQPFSHPFTPALRALLSRQRVTGDAIQPQAPALRSRHVVQAAPCHQEYLRDHIGRVLRVTRTPLHIGKQSPTVLAIQTYEAGLGADRPSHPVIPISAHDSSASGGSSLTATVKTSNLGPAAATNVITALVIPNGVTVTSTGGGSRFGSAIYWTDSSIASGASVTHTVTFKVATNAHGNVLIPAAAASTQVKDP